MVNFFPDQRWTSEAEPELGLGIVTETSKGRVKIDFPAAGETRLYAVESAPLRRVRFKEGDVVVDTEGRTLKIERVIENGDFFLYLGEGRVLSEAELGNVAVKHGAEERLLLGDVDTPREFALRRQTLQNNHDRRISDINGFLGGRIDLIPHQLFIAHEVSGRYAPRVLLSDEVGLGKTIEACLILHRLLLRGRISRALILVPDSLVHQWFVELLRRFNLWFHIFDEERCASIEAHAPEDNPFLDDQLILCSTSFLAKSRKRASQAIAADWDMLVVDEAHHLQWSFEAVSPEYQVVEMLSRKAAGLLLLTATPEQLGLESHFARLRLLDPVRYADFESFQNESLDNQATADIVDQISVGNRLKANEIKFLESLLGKARIEGLKTRDENAKKLLIQDLLDQHGPGRAIFRNRRIALDKFPKRIAKLIALPAAKDSEKWQQTMAKELSSDLGENERTPSYDFDTDLRVEWLLTLAEELYPEKILLICNRKEKVLALEQALKEGLNLQVGVFHEELSLIQRDRNAAWFSEPDGARILLCSEIGSEGRNFQFAHHLVLFDLPLNPELLEQRIGRLDRIGQTEDIQIHVPFLKGSGQEILAKWYHEGINAFEKNLSAGSKIFELFGQRLRALALENDSPTWKEQLSELISATATTHSDLLTNLANGRDRLMEMNSFRPEIGNQLVAQITEADNNVKVENFMLRIFEQFGIETEDLAARTYLLHPNMGNAQAFPAMPDKGTTATFERKRALSREDITFLSWDHPMVTGAIDMVLSTGLGSASFAILPRSGTPAILLELIFVLETAGNQNNSVDRFLPNTPIRIVVNHRGEDVTSDYPSDEIDQELYAGEIDDFLENEMLVEAILPKMIAEATELAEREGMKAILKGLKRMQSTLQHEIERLKALQTKNKHIRPEEIQNAVDEQKQFETWIKAANIRLDAIQLIQVGKAS